MCQSDDAYHGEPQEHQRSEQLSNGISAELLDKEEHREDGNGNGDDRRCRLVDLQTLDGREYGDGRRYDAIGNKSAGPNDGKKVEPCPPMFPHKGIKG